MDKPKVLIILVILFVVGLGVTFILISGKIQLQLPAVPPENQVEVSKPLAPGASPISPEGKIIAPSGEEARTDVSPDSVQAPRPSLPLSSADIAQIEKSGIGQTIKITMSLGIISPSSFEVRKGEVVNLIVSSTDRSHIFYFTDPAMKGVSIGLNAKETRAISFQAPTKAGEYAFSCDLPGHSARGENGKMIVK